MKSILWFKEIGKNSIPFVGGKGANLGEMINAGFEVPPGFVITVEAFWDFLEKNHLKEKIIEAIDSIEVENTEELENVSAEIRELILEARIDESLKLEITKAYQTLGEKQIAWLSTSDESIVAVRSSATAEDLPTASFAGQHESFLNVKGTKNLLEAVKKCWASLYQGRAVYYRKKNNFPTEKVGIAVVVQKMVNSEQSGVMFTADPTGDESKIIIEAGYGLGETIVQGAITPDTYTIDKKKMKLIDKKISEQSWMLIRGKEGNERVDVAKQKREKQKISDQLILNLAKTGKQIEQHYKAPQDIEFAIEKNQIFITQTRAITTLGLEKQMEKEKKRKIEAIEKPILSGLAASPGIAVGKIRIIETIKEMEKIREKEILVTKMTNPDWVPAMKKAVAIITDEGGTTCHAAIVSRELGIPCIVGTEYATKILEEGKTVTVDGYAGKVYSGKVELEKPEKIESELIEEKEVKELEEKFEEEGIEIESEQAVEEAKTETEKETAIEEEKEELEKLIEKRMIKVKVNVALPEAAEKAAQTNADGVGLLRAEHMITSTGYHPAEFLREGKEKELIEAVKKGIRIVAEKFRGKPVWYRTFDARSDEFREMKGGEKEPQELNPMIGWHGIRRSLDEPELIKAEFRAVKELFEEGFDNIGVMIPFVQSAEEFREAKKLAQEIGLIPKKDCEFGVMIETPASVWIIEELIEEGIEFISFGTNDLTQLTLGIDRDNERIQKLFNELHPAILAQCRFVIEKCKAKGVKTSICGQAASNPEMVEKLVEFGIDSVSANIDAVEEIKKVVFEKTKELILKE